MKPFIAAICLLAIASAAQAASCPEFFPSTATDNDIVNAKIVSLASQGIKLGNCKAKITGAVNANTFIAGPSNQSDMATKVQVIQTTNIYNCDAANSRDPGYTLFIKINRFEPISEPYGDGFSLSVGSTCHRPSSDATTVETSVIVSKK